MDPGKVERLLKQEWEKFTSWSSGSGAHNKKAAETLPLGVTSSFQHWDPYPITIEKARGAYLFDVDGNQLLDLSMGFGAMLVGHLNPTVVDRVKAALDETGTLFVTPSTQATEVAERFKKRFGVDVHVYAPYAYDAATAMVQAMQKADSIEPAKYMSALKTLSFEGVSGKVSFDTKGDIKDGAVTVYQFADGKWVAR